MGSWGPPRALVGLIGPIGLLAVVGVPAAQAQPAGAATAEPTLVVFFAPRPSPPGTDAARDALGRAAEQRGAALVDRSHVAPPPSEAPRHLARAIEAYTRVAYADALGSADAGLADAAASGARGVSLAELGELYLYRGLAAGELGDSARAWDDFVRAAALDPTRALDQARYAPRVIERFKRAVEAVLAQPRVRLTIDAPTGCARWLDGRAIAETELDASRGEHLVRVECPGSLPWAGAVTLVTDGQRIRPVLVAEAGPTAAELVALSRDHGMGGAVLAVVSPAGAASVLVLTRIDRRGRRGQRVSATLRAADAGRAAASAFERLLAPPIALRPLGVAPRRWYQSPVLWGAVGVTLATAVLLPFALGGSETATGFDVEVQPRP